MREDFFDRQQDAAVHRHMSCRPGAVLEYPFPELEFCVAYVCNFLYSRPPQSVFEVFVCFFGIDEGKSSEFAENLFSSSSRYRLYRKERPMRLHIVE